MAQSCWTYTQFLPFCHILCIHH
uniref:Uncharacterized protein n=1 Tax=Arundo donax TaxID=35708 RepID=A0A0A8YSD0_ARUDO